jgi:hypothetical protein
MAGSLSALQVSILKSLAKRPQSKVADLVRAHYGAISREKRRKAYQSAFAAVSRAVVRLETRDFVEVWLPGRFGSYWIRLSPAGRAALKTIA